MPEREAYLAAYIDRLPDGAAIDTKTLAREQPRYGQQAVRSALRKLADLGHLLRIREKAGEGLTRWVSRTYFSRTPRPTAWWSLFLADRRTSGSADSTPTPPTHSIAYRALASLGAADKRMMLSARECEELEPLAAAWFARNVTVEQFRYAMTNGLPTTIQCPGAFARKRLIDRIPPEPAPVPECRDCRTSLADKGSCTCREPARVPTTRTSYWAGRARTLVRETKERIR
ncbi:hypothetical protein ACFZB9_29555 [Kitasatospora sp. NPDC008050]|uniref:hypothetical protein n=1 Tax=Kitasatospora sp. NPDC008050 TaxID=3364021 RepID=UPI0036E9A7B7